MLTDTRGADVYAYTYDAANRMASVSLNGVLQAEYEYNFLGQQVIRRLASGDTIHSIHDIWGHRIAEYLYDEVAGTSSLIREYIWAGDRIVGAWENGSYYAVRTDHIGRPVFATNTRGTIVWEATYLPFGGVHTSTGPTIDLRFPGQWFQMEAGLHQNWMRDYDPTLGRYLQADPLGLVDGASVYGYALQNPGRYTDPTGEFGVIGAVIGGAVNAAAQFFGNWYKYGDAYTAARCIDLKNVAAAGAVGAFGLSPLATARKYGFGQAAGVGALSYFSKIEAGLLSSPPITIGDGCECSQIVNPIPEALDRFLRIFHI